MDLSACCIEPGVGVGGKGGRIEVSEELLFSLCEALI
jgi:hypothetical protein